MRTPRHDALSSRPAPSGIVGEYLGFLRASGKWWLLPIMVMILALGLLVFLAGTGAAPFIYTLF